MGLLAKMADRDSDSLTLELYHALDLVSMLWIFSFGGTSQVPSTPQKLEKSVTIQDQ